MNQLQKEAEIEVMQIIREGKIPIVKLSIFDYLDSLKPSDSLKGKIEYTIEIYEELLRKIKNLPPELKFKYLLALKKSDVKDNQELENEDPFLISLHQEIDPLSALEIAINHYGQEYTKEELIYLHDFLLLGTSSSDKLGLRENNLKFVGTWENGERHIQYFPILEEEIDEALRRFITYYNSNINNVDRGYDAILKPIIYHGLLATLQLFKDGNTRLARVIQHVELWGMLNNIVDSGIELPITYATRQYFPFRTRYRELIKNIAVNNDDDAWNEWFSFNIARIQDSIYKNEQNIQLAKRF